MWSIWHRAKPSHVWALVAMREDETTAVKEFNRQIYGHRAGQVRLVSPDGVVTRRSAVRREPIAVA